MSKEQNLKPIVTSLNPYAGQQVAQVSQPSAGNALMTAEMQRSIAEVQAAYMVAMSRPRNQMASVDKMLLECQRPNLAEAAIYSFPRGGQDVSGPSIRLAEAMKRNWGHMKSGWRCLERRLGVSVLQAYAYDYETGVADERIFEVKHIRNTKKGDKPITDERDIYELEANQAARRVRSCILALIPVDVVDACVEECERTLKAKADTSPDNIKKMITAFLKFGVDRKMIEKRIGRSAETITPAQMVGLQKIYNSLRDEMSSIDQWFDVSAKEVTDIEEAKPDKPEEKTLEAIKEKHSEKKPENCPDCGGSGKIEFLDEEDGQLVEQTCKCVVPIQESLV